MFVYMCRVCVCIAKCDEYRKSLIIGVIYLIIAVIEHGHLLFNQFQWRVSRCSAFVVSNLINYAGCIQALFTELSVSSGTGRCFNILPVYRTGFNHICTVNEIKHQTSNVYWTSVHWLPIVIKWLSSVRPQRVLLHIFEYHIKHLSHNSLTYSLHTYTIHVITQVHTSN